MSENEIKPVAWRCIWSKSGKPVWEQYHDESDPMPEQWDVRPNEVRPLYGQSAIDRLRVQLKHCTGALEAEVLEVERRGERIDRLTAERDAAVAERDAILDAAVRARRCLAWGSQQRPEFAAEYEALDAAIDAARVQEPQA